jgi:hypothetical protein
MVGQMDVHFWWATTLRLAGQNKMQVFLSICSISYSHLENKSHGINNILALGRLGFEPCLAILVYEEIKNKNNVCQTQIFVTIKCVGQ